MVRFITSSNMHGGTALTNTNNDVYFKKYIKYKQKYLQKKQQKGGSNKII
jgi:hypothetical protein